MKFNLFFTFKGVVGNTIEAPNNTNPVEMESMGELLKMLGDKIPSPMGLECVGIRIVKVEEPLI